MPAPAKFQLQSAGDLVAADAHLKTVSYVDGGHTFTKADVAAYENAKKFVKSTESLKEQFPSLCRWMRHIERLTEDGAASGSSIAPGLLGVSSTASARLSENPAGSIVAPVVAGGGAGKNTNTKQQSAKQAQAAQPKGSPQAGPQKPAYVKGSNVKQVDCVVVPMAERKKPLPQNPSQGVAAGNLPSTVGKIVAKDGKDKPKTKYITTAIMYTNGWPHCGHAYEAIQADTIARFFRLNGYDTFFQSGTDEHGQKIAEAAAAQGMGKPKDLCDMYVQGFQGLYGRNLISEDQFIRTSCEEHYKVVRDLWKKVSEKGDIYLAEYEGWYMVREERFVTDQEAEEWKYLDPVNGKPLQRMAFDFVNPFYISSVL